MGRLDVDGGATEWAEFDPIATPGEYRLVVRTAAGERCRGTFRVDAGRAGTLRHDDAFDCAVAGRAFDDRTAWVGP